MVHHDAQALATQWLDLVAYCDDRANFDSKMFAMRHKNIADAYKRLDYQAQGEFTHIISTTAHKAGE